MPTVLLPLKMFIVGYMMFTWKWFYYAPNTFKVLTTILLYHYYDVHVDVVLLRPQHLQCAELLYYYCDVHVDVVLLRAQPLPGAELLYCSITTILL